MTYEDFLQYKFYPTFFNGTWISDTEILFRDQVRSGSIPGVQLAQYGGLSLRDVSTSSTTTVVSHNQFLQLHPVSYSFSADRFTH